TVNLSVCANAFPYTFGGHVFNAAGSITDTIPGTGCDTIRTITVAQLPLLTSTVNLSVCANAFPYTFSGHIFNAAGSITDTIPGTGCDTIRTITVAQLPLLTSTVNIAVCANAFPYTFGGHVFSAVGSLTDTVSSTTGGCDTLRTINVTELPLLTSTVNLSVCANAFPYTFGGHIFNAAGSITDTIPGTGCDTFRTITVAQLPLLTSTVNLSVCANAFPYTFGGHVFSAVGSLTDTVSSTTGGCDTLRTINVAQLPLLTSTVNLSVCANAFPYTFGGHVFNAAGSITDTIPGTVCDTIRTITVDQLPLLTSTVNISVCANAFPYTFDAHVFYAMLFLSDTVSSTTGGCDTLRTINVTELPLLTSTVNLSVCANAF